MSDGLIVAITASVTIGVAGYLVWMLIDSIRKERRRSGLHRIWPNFALSLTFCALFFVSWGAQAFAQWGLYRSEEIEHGVTPDVGGFLVHFGQATLENWQSEFLQLFSFVVLAAILIHRGSAESRDSEDRIEERLREIDRKLDELAGGEARSSR
jgi:hypothetical protein